MTQRLLIMRHAKSDWDTEAVCDFDRPLSKRGWRDAPRMGRWILKNHLVPDWVVSSTAVRAKQTALEVCQALGIEKQVIRWEPAIYEAGLKELLAVIKNCPEDKHRILLVGHNPGLEQLVYFLTRKTCTIPTTGLACLQLLEPVTSLKSGTAQLELFVSPKAIRESP